MLINSGLKRCIGSFIREHKQNWSDRVLEEWSSRKVDI